MKRFLICALLILFKIGFSQEKKISILYLPESKYTIQVFGVNFQIPIESKFNYSFSTSYSQVITDLDFYHTYIPGVLFPSQQVFLLPTTLNTNYPSTAIGSLQSSIFNLYFSSGVNYSIYPLKTKKNLSIEIGPKVGLKYSSLFFITESSPATWVNMADSLNFQAYTGGHFKGFHWPYLGLDCFVSYNFKSNIFIGVLGSIEELFFLNFEQPKTRIGVLFNVGFSF